MSKTPFAIVALDGGFGGSYNLNRAINEHSAKYQSVLITSRPSQYQFGDGIDVKTQHDKAARLLEHADRLWICDGGGLLTIARYLDVSRGTRLPWLPTNPASAPIYKWLRNKSLIFYWSGSGYRDNYMAVSSAVQKLRCSRTYAMCDLLRLDPKALPLMQCYDDIAPGREKFPAFTVGHTPGMKWKNGEVAEKGTPHVIAGLEAARERCGLHYFVLKNMPHRLALKVKAKCHAFVDQIMPDVAGLGKSGLEAMLMGIPTLCDVRLSRFDGPYAGCPVIPVRGAKELCAEVVRLFQSAEHCAEVGKRSLDWAQRLRFKPTVEYLDATMEWA